MSDSDSSVDSDSGIRFKTQSVRNLSNKDSLIFNRQKKHNDYEYNNYDKRYNRDDDYRYRKRHKHSEDRIRSSRREDYFQDERTSSKRENLIKTYDYDSVNHKSKEYDKYHESKRKKHFLKSEDNDSLDPYGPSLPHHTVINKHKDTQETKKEIVKSKHGETNDTYGSGEPILPNTAILKSEDFHEIKKQSVKLEDDVINDTYGPVLPSNAILKNEGFHATNRESVKLEYDKTNDCINGSSTTGKVKPTILYCF